MERVEIGDCILYRADCLDVLRPLPAGGVDAVVTDPPYGVDKAEWDTEFPTEWIAEAERVSPRLLVMVGNKSLIKAGKAFSDYRDCIVLWAKNGMTYSAIAFGNFIPVLACGDWDWVPRPNLLPFVVNTAEHIRHPSPKPLAAMLTLIEKYTEKGWTILDPFMGSGTTGVACLRTGRKFIGVEIDPGYFDVAVKRIRAELESTPLFDALELEPATLFGEE